MSLNLKSLFTSGFISGLIINLSAFAMVPMVGDQFNTVLANRGLPPLGNPAYVFFSGVSFFMGFFLVWLYTVAKVQFGSGVKTAAIVAGIFWVIAYLLPNVAMVVYGFMPVQLTVIGTAWGLVELLVACIIGSGLYRENEKSERRYI